MSKSLLENRDYTVIVARLTSTPLLTMPGAQERWQKAEAAIVALAKKCEEFDPDGITIYIAGRYVKKYERATAEDLAQFFQNNELPGNLDLAAVLQTALDDYFTRKAAGQAKVNGETIIVVLDGEPRDRMAVVKTIVKATQKIERDQELGIGFAQIGDNIMARGFLTALDDDLHAAGAKFDIVDTKILDSVEEASLTQFLVDTLID